MGGFGSGWRAVSRTTVEACLRLSSTTLMRDRVLRPNVASAFTITWSNGAGEPVSSIGLDAMTGADAGTLRLHYARSSTGERMDYQVKLTTTLLPWQRLRWWFLCPLLKDSQPCGRRVGKLYLPPGACYFGCQRCHDLTYTSCQESHKFDAALASVGATMGISGADVARLLSRRYREERRQDRRRKRRRHH